MRDKEYIERGALIEFVKQNTPNIDGDTTMQCVERSMRAAPAADVVKVVHGEWIFEHDPVIDPKRYFVRIVCSCCGLKTGEVSNFCPKCGAKMDGEREEQT